MLKYGHVLPFLYEQSPEDKAWRWEENQGCQAEAASLQNLLEICSP